MAGFMDWRAQERMRERSSSCLASSVREAGVPPPPTTSWTVPVAHKFRSAPVVYGHGLLDLGSVHQSLSRWIVVPLASWRKKTWMKGKNVTVTLK